MKTAKSNREEVRENSLTIPMNADEKHQVKLAAEKMGVPMSTFARLVLKDYIKKEGL